MSFNAYWPTDPGQPSQPSPAQPSQPAHPGAAFANSFKFRYLIVIKIRWKILLEIIGPIPLHFSIESLLEINGKCSWRFVGQVL